MRIQRCKNHGRVPPPLAPVTAMREGLPLRAGSGRNPRSGLRSRPGGPSCSGDGIPPVAEQTPSCPGNSFSGRCLENPWFSSLVIWQSESPSMSHCQTTPHVQLNVLSTGNGCGLPLQALRSGRDLLPEVPHPGTGKAGILPVPVGEGTTGTSGGPRGSVQVRVTKNGAGFEIDLLHRVIPAIHAPVDHRFASEWALASPGPPGFGVVPLPPGPPKPRDSEMKRKQPSRSLRGLGGECPEGVAEFRRRAGRPGSRVAGCGRAVVGELSAANWNTHGLRGLLGSKPAGAGESQTIREPRFEASIAAGSGILCRP